MSNPVISLAVRAQKNWGNASPNILHIACLLGFLLYEKDETMSLNVAFGLGQEQEGILP